MKAREKIYKHMIEIVDIQVEFAVRRNLYYEILHKRGSRRYLSNDILIQGIKVKVGRDWFYD